MDKITYTKAIKGGKLKLTEMELGASLVGKLLGTRESKYGANLLVDVQGREIEIFAAGNVKRKTVKDVVAGLLTAGSNIRITRLEDKAVEGSKFNTTDFDVEVTQGNASGNTAGQASVKDKLQAIRDRRTTN